jgi:hypothetical protein
MSYSITAVHLERAPGASHDHIARVKLLGQPEDFSRAQIIGWIPAGTGLLHLRYGAGARLCALVPVLLRERLSDDAPG